MRSTLQQSRLRQLFGHKHACLIQTSRFIVRLTNSFILVISTYLLQNAAKMMHSATTPLSALYKSMKEGKDQESIQSSTTPDLGYQ